MALVQVKAIRGFVFDRKIVEVGEVVTVGAGMAKSLISAHQAVPFEPEPAPKPSPVVVRQEPALSTQIPDKVPARKAKD